MVGLIGGRHGFLIATAVVLVLGAGYVVGDVADVVPGPLTAATEPTPPVPTPDPAAPGVTLAEPAGAVVAAPGAGAPMPEGPTLLAALSPLLAVPSLAPGVSVSVTDVLTGQALVAVDANRGRAPASTTKLLTAAAALHSLDPDETLPTEVVGGVSPDQVVLRAGGDVLLGAGPGDPSAVNGRAGLSDLAARTAAELSPAPGGGPVTVALDDTLFSGPGVSPSWQPGDVGGGFVAPVSALAVDAGRRSAGIYAPRQPDPALAAADQFAELLRAEGVDVAPGVTRVSAQVDAPVLAEVRSAPIADLVAYTLITSDNTTAEVLGRLVALRTGGAGSFEGATTAVRDGVGELGIDVADVRLADTSGLGDGTLIPAAMLTDLLTVIASGDQPRLAPILTALPIAGFSGTLTDRFQGPDAAGGTGVVRAKTGSLTGVTALAGLLTTADGRVLAFAMVADAVPGGATGAARAAMDRAATVVTACGCR